MIDCVSSPVARPLTVVRGLPFRPGTELEAVPAELELVSAELELLLIGVTIGLWQKDQTFNADREARTAALTSRSPSSSGRGYSGG
jgi:hypothetical protein